MTTEKAIDPEEAAAHVRYYIPLTSEEYHYMLEEATSPKLATIKASTRMPLYDRVNGMLSADQCLPLLTYTSTLKVKSSPTTWITSTWFRPTSAMRLYMMKSNVEACVCSRGITSPLHLVLIRTVSLILLNLSYNRFGRLRSAGTTTSLPHWFSSTLLQVMPGIFGSSWRSRIYYKNCQRNNLSSGPLYLGPLIFKVELTDTTKVHLLEHMYKLQCLPSITDWNPRTMDYIRGSTSALEVYKKMRIYSKWLKNWRKTSTQVEKAATAEDGDKVKMPPTKRQATEPATEQAT